MSVPHRDSTCPARGPGLEHMAPDPDYVCAECGVQCLIETIELPNINARHKIAEKDCMLDHGNMISGRLGTNSSPIRGAGGTKSDWSHCIVCGVQVEQGQDMSGPAGPPWGKGRIGSLRNQSNDQSLWAFLAWHFSKVAP